MAEHGPKAVEMEAQRDDNKGSRNTKMAEVDRKWAKRLKVCCEVSQQCFPLLGCKEEQTVEKCMVEMSRGGCQTFFSQNHSTLLR